MCKLYSKIPYDFELAILKYPEEIKGLVSVIIPLYNSEIYLRETLNSVITQTYKNWEAILIDDGSTDSTSEICFEYVKKDARFKYIYKNNEGTLLARKTGLENSRGEFIANLDHDDAYHPLFLEKMLAKIKEKKYDFVLCNYEDLNGEKKYHHLEDYKLYDDKAKNCKRIEDGGAIYLTLNKLIKRSVYAKVLFPKINIADYEDLIQMFQIIYNSEQAEIIPENLYMQRSDSATRQLRYSKIERKRVTNVVGAIALYSIMERLFGTEYAEKSINFQRGFLQYFLLNKKTIANYKIEYAENFIPAFLKSLKKVDKSYYAKLAEKEIYIWGAGHYGILTALSLKQENVKIKGFIDTNANEIKTRLGLPVFEPSEVIYNKNQDCNIIIAVKNKVATEEIINTLSSVGLEKTVIGENPFL